MVPVSDAEMDWKEFTVAMMVFSIIGIAFVFILQEVQQYLPLNPLAAGPVSWDLSLNTAVSFATNTNWQFYVPETAVSYLTQMVGLAGPELHVCCRRYGNPCCFHLRVLTAVDSYYW